MMRKAMLWGAAIAVALISIPATANVVVVKSLGRRQSLIRRAKLFLKPPKSAYKAATL